MAANFDPQTGVAGTPRLLFQTRIVAPAFDLFSIRGRRGWEFPHQLAARRPLLTADTHNELAGIAEDALIKPILSQASPRRRARIRPRTTSE